MWIDCRQLVEECKYARKAEGDKFKCSHSFAGMLNADNCYYVEIESDEILDKELNGKPIFTITMTYRDDYIRLLETDDLFDAELYMQKLRKLLMRGESDG